MDTILKRINQIAEHEGITITALEQIIGASKGVLSRALAKNTDIQSKWLVKIVENYPIYDAAWILSGKGEMLKSSTRQAHLIPLYSDVASDQLTECGELYTSTYIDPGDWFPAATAAIRYHNTGMIEYPQGCLLILREKSGPSELVWGEHYLIEYGDNRILRTVQPADDRQHVYGYATDEATYPDGRMKYPPVLIEMDQIKRLFQVLGHISKRQSNDRILIKY